MPLGISDILVLVKLLALAMGVTLLSPFIYPAIRGVRRGDKVIIINTNPFVRMRSRIGVAQNDAHKGQVLKVMTDVGDTVECEIVDYEGTFSRAKVKIKDHGKDVEVM